MDADSVPMLRRQILETAEPDADEASRRGALRFGLGRGLPRLEVTVSRVLALLTLTLIAGSAPANPGDSYPRIEASFNLPNFATDPFDYTTTDVRVQIVQPDGSSVSLPAFYDGGSTWRVRHTPLAPGPYRIAVVTLNGQPVSAANLQPTAWNVTDPATGPGFVRVDPANPRRFITDSGRRYFPVGENVAWDTSNRTNVTAIFSRMGAARENWSRVWMDHWDSKNLDWPKVGTFGNLSLTVAQKWDAIITAAEQAGIRFQMTLHHHGQYSTTTDSNWGQNPYNLANGGFLTSATAFFTNTTARALTKRKLRYAVARWGYSPAILAWELFNEVQFTDAAQSGQWNLVAAWHDEMAQFLRAQDSYQHLITTSSELTQSIWNQCDYYQHHDYPADVVSALRDAPDVPAGYAVRPIFGGECGLASPPVVGIPAAIWPGLMAGQSGASQPWWWDRIDAENDYALFRSLADFVNASGLADQETLSRFTPVTTSPQLGSLSFSPGGGWQTATTNFFVVLAGVPDGIGSLPSFLQGRYHPDLSTNTYIFRVNYPQAGTFAAQVTQVASSGAALALNVDGVTVTNHAFGAAASNYTPNLTLTADVPAGWHTVKLINGGLDWLVLGNITLNPYVPLLAAYGIGNTNFAALWLWHRTNLLSATASNPVTGTVVLNPLAAGDYAGTWWDTEAGVALSNFTFNVATPGAAVTLTPPPILRSASLFLGPPAQAEVLAPALTQSLGTNAPAVVLSFAITNGGGLPLAYSLTVTGSAPVKYAARNSSQAGGPAFVWKDISGVGRDLTPRFMALAPPRSAQDEGIAGPIDIGFDFPFFSGAQNPGLFTQLYVSPNGFVTFSPFVGNTATNTTLPNAAAPANAIACFWDDLDLGTTGRVYAASDPVAGTFTVQFQDVSIKGTPATVTCQLILKSSGEILFQYRTLGLSNTCTVGLEDSGRSQGLQVAFNDNSLRSNSAIRLTPTPWLSLPVNAGLIPRSSSDNIGLTFDAAGLAPGDYAATLLVKTADPALPAVALPLHLTISSELPAAPSGLSAVPLSWSRVALSWFDNSANEQALVIERKLGPTGDFTAIANLPAGTTNFTDASVASRTTYFYRLRATNAFGASPYTAEVGVVTPWAPLDFWRQAHFGSAEPTGPAANDADPDHDGLVNAMEYALGLDPQKPDRDPLAFGVVSGHLTVSFKRPRPAPADIGFAFDVTSDLASGWQAGPDFVSQLIADNLDGTETVTLTDLAAAPSASARYLRIRVQPQ